MMGEAEFDAFYSVSYSRLAGQLYALTGDWAAAQEVVLEAFVRAWDHRSRFDLEAAPDSWVRTVARQLAGSRRRRGGPEPAGDGGSAGSTGLTGTTGPTGTTGSAEAERVEFVEALRRLGADERYVAVLYYLCDLRIEDIAAETGVTVGAVRAALARSRAALAVACDGEHRYEELVGALYDFANRHAQPHLTAQHVREQGERRRLSRRSATVGGVGVLALAGVIVVALLAGSPAPPRVAPTAGHPTGAHHAAAKQSRS